MRDNAVRKLRVQFMRHKSGVTKTFEQYLEACEQCRVDVTADITLSMVEVDYSDGGGEPEGSCYGLCRS